MQCPNDYNLKIADRLNRFIFLTILECIRSHTEQDRVDSTLLDASGLEVSRGNFNISILVLSVYYQNIVLFKLRYLLLVGTNMLVSPSARGAHKEN
jgi:hypothetical protein